MSVFWAYVTILDRKRVIFTIVLCILSYSPKFLLKNGGVCRILPYSLQYLGFEGGSNSPYLPNDMFSRTKSLESLLYLPNEDGCTERFKNKNK